MIGLFLANLVYRFTDWRTRVTPQYVDVKRLNRENRS
jgi:hypothetical protein